MRHCTMSKHGYHVNWPLLPISKVFVCLSLCLPMFCSGQFIDIEPSDKSEHASVVVSVRSNGRPQI